MTKPVGLTKDQGWQIGVRRTLPIKPVEAWMLLMSPQGLKIWLGTGVTEFKKGDVYQTNEGTTGDIRSFDAGRMIRLRWQPAGWDFESTVQVRVLPAKRGTTLSFHHERLQDAEQREKMRTHWLNMINQLDALAQAQVGE